MAAHPDHRQGLEIAARASRAVGEEQRAAAYERLLAALAGTGAPAGPAPAGTPQAPEPLPAGEVLPGEAEIDAFLEEVLGSDPDGDRPRITLALAPGLPEGRILLAEAQIANGRLDEARAAAEQARSLAPDRPGGHVMLSMVAAQAGRWREVEHHARAALALDPEDTAALNNLGVALQKLGHRREAVHYLGTASRLDPRNPLYKTNAVRAASRYWGPAVLVVLIGVQFLTGDFAVGFALAATGIAGWLIVSLMQGKGQRRWTLIRRLEGRLTFIRRLGGRLGRAPLERWAHRGAPTADPKASPELMSALRRERRSLDPVGRRTRFALRRALIAVVAALALFFGSAFLVQAAQSRHGGGDIALNALAAASCAGVAALMFRLALRPGGRQRRR